MSILRTISVSNFTPIFYGLKRFKEVSRNRIIIFTQIISHLIHTIHIDNQQLTTDLKHRHHTQKRNKTDYPIRSQ